MAKSKLPYDIVEEHGRTYYVYTETGFKTPHLRNMLNHIENRTGTRPAAPSQKEALAIGEPWAEAATKAKPASDTAAADK